MTFESVSFAVGIMALIVSVVGIVIPILFYIRGRDSEQAIKTTLAKIETSSATLEKVTNRTLDRYTRYFTEERHQTTPEQQAIAKFFETATVLMTSTTQTPQPGPQQYGPTFAARELVGVAFYSYVSNWVVQQLLPGDVNQIFDGNWQWHLRVLNQSKEDFLNSMQWLELPEILREVRNITVLKTYYDAIVAGKGSVIDQTELVQRSS